MKASPEQRRIVHAVLGRTAEVLGLSLAEIREAVAAPPPRPPRAKPRRVACRRKAKPAKPRSILLPALPAPPPPPPRQPDKPAPVRAGPKPPPPKTPPKARPKPPPKRPPEPLSDFETAVLRQLIRNPLTTPTVISGQTGKPVGTIARAIESLAAKGYIRRGHNQACVLRLPDGRPVPPSSAQDKDRQIEAFLAGKGATKCRTVVLEASCFGQELWTHPSSRRAGAS